MKTPLRYQVSEYDCGPTSLYNAISFLFERHEIPAEVLKIIDKYTLDLSDDQKNPGKGGTSKKALNKISNLLNKYRKHNFRMQCKILNGEEVTLEKINVCLKNNGCALVSVWLENVEHYCIITKIHKNKVYIFDPYYLIKNNYRHKKVKIISNKIFTHNRFVTLKRLFSKTKKDFSMGEKEKRMCLLMNRLV